MRCLWAVEILIGIFSLIKRPTKKICCCCWLAFGMRTKWCKMIYDWKGMKKKMLKILRNLHSHSDFSFTQKVANYACEIDEYKSEKWQRTIGREQKTSTIVDTWNNSLIFIWIGNGAGARHLSTERWMERKKKDSENEEEENTSKYLWRMNVANEIII